jgi:transposase-like protein
MGRKRRSFTAEFKAEAVRLCRVGDRPVKQVAKDLDLTETALREWGEACRHRRREGAAGRAHDVGARGTDAAAAREQAPPDGARNIKKPSRASPDLLGEKLGLRYEDGGSEGAAGCFLEARPR